MSSDRNVEIWSTRLQREILALESTDDESTKKTVQLLPPFIKPIGNTLNIEGGIAKIEFRIDVEVSEEEEDGGVVDKVNEVPDDSLEEKEEEGGDSKESVETKDDKESTSAAQDEKKEQDAENKDETKEKDGTDNDTKDSESEVVATKADIIDDTAEQKQQKDKADDPHVVLVLDASLYWRPDSSRDSNTGQSPQCYPFQKPLAIIKSGSSLFSNSTIMNGDEIDIDLDWTPSIHLSDAATNVALKIRECVKRGEPIYAVNREEDVDDADGISSSIIREAREAKESLLETKKAVGAMFSSGLSSLSTKGSSFAAKSQSASKGILESLSTTLAAESGTSQGEDAENETEGTAKEFKEVPDVGDEIDLSDHPWNKCIGMYSCKAIKRPAFVEALMENSSSNKKEVSEV